MSTVKSSANQAEACRLFEGCIHIPLTPTYKLYAGTPNYRQAVSYRRVRGVEDHVGGVTLSLDYCNWIQNCDKETPHLHASDQHMADSLQRICT